MDRIAFLFSGQGDQYPGMGKDLYESYPEAKEIFDLCDTVRPGTAKQCFSGTEEQLKETRHTQPCLFAMELAAANVLSAHGIHPQAVAGFSLGELAALTFAGIVDVETGFRLVCRRAELMQAAAEKVETSMAAVVKLDNATVERLCARYSAVYPVNYNCPGQISVAGLSSEMADFAVDVKNAGGRAIPLKVRVLPFELPEPKTNYDLSRPFQVSTYYFNTMVDKGDGTVGCGRRTVLDHLKMKGEKRGMTV